MLPPLKYLRCRELQITVAALLVFGCDRAEERSSLASPPAPPTPGVVNEPAAEEEQTASSPLPQAVIPATPHAVPHRTPAEIARDFRAAAEPEERGYFVDELWQVGTPEAVETLRQLFVAERENDVKVDIISQVAAADPVKLRDGCFGLLLAALTPGQPPEVRTLAAHLLTESKDPRALTLLLQFAQDVDPQVREAAKEALDARKEKE